ncbi:energy transducer TonB [Sphingomonas sp.]|uniref:energy transducer TonB n=1 Tax=Sphingomonas sp. TaxID=28214 RepID=UPI003CC6B23C
MKVMAALCALATFLTGAADTPPSPMLEPNGPWVVEGSEGLCVLTRSYGPDAAKITVGLQPMFSFPMMELFIITPDRLTGRRAGNATLSLGGAPLRGEYISVDMAAGRRFTRIQLAATAMEQIKAAQTMTVTARPVSITVHLVRTAAGATALDRCERQLLQSWQVDPDAMTPERAPTPLNPEQRFTPERYPQEALAQGLQGRVIAVVQVGADGIANGCHVVASAGQTLDDATCINARRVRFRPGKDATGHATPSIYLLPVRWVLPFG